MSRKSLIICLLVSVVALKFQTGLAEDLPDWTSQIRKDHPRLFFNNDTWPAVKQRALGSEESAWRALKASVDRRLIEPHSKNEPRDLGVDAAKAAFAFLMTNDARYLDLANK